MCARDALYLYLFNLKLITLHPVYGIHGVVTIKIIFLIKNNTKIVPFKGIHGWMDGNKTNVITLR